MYYSTYIHLTYDVQAKNFLQIGSKVQEERRVIRVGHRLGAYIHTYT